MEHFFGYRSEPVFSWLEEEVPAKSSAFVSYTQHQLNVAPAFVERGRRHMLSERMRREKQKHNYMRLHSLLPSGTKRDKHSIILTAVQEVEQLKKWRQELERQKSAMNKMLGARESSSEGSEMEEAKIRINVARPSSAVDSMLEVLKCLKQTGSNIRLIQSRFLPQQFSAVLGIETKVGAAEVEKAVHRTLFQVEKNFRYKRVEPSYTNGSRSFHSGS
ncbi:Transcription factor bHLH92 like [Heracleum sosnowskyi]|uniref:Transcription factor bHLH92 like n=1 Tax=Heracleum sosnowskyi TaxID=360622 RepID=A0AAD8I8J4_9APIA|nr:Transcription factor bHLH92 like [Heracleum sosnowskyi]